MEQIYSNKERIFDMRELCHVLIKKIWIILLVGFLSAILLYFLSVYVIEWKYESTTKIYILSKQDNTSEITYSNLQIGSQLINDYMALITSRVVTEQVISELGLPMKHEELRELIHLENPEDTRILIITVTYSDPVIAKQIADNLRIAATSMIVDFIEFENVTEIEEANVPEKQATPNVSFNTLFGMAIGLLLSSSCIILGYIKIDSVKKYEEIGDSLDLTILGVIPYQRKHKSSLWHEAYINTTSNLQYYGNGMKVICLAANKLDEERYVSAYKLAETLANMGKKTIFINANMKKKTHEDVKVMDSKLTGLSNYLTINYHDDIIQQSENENLHMIHSGPIINNQFEVLSNCKFGELLLEVSDCYDYVLVLSPPLNDTNEGIIVAKECDGVILLLHGNEDRYENIRKVVSKLEKVKSNIIGAIFFQGRG